MCEIKDITDKEGYKIIRKRKKINLKEVSNYINLSVSTISRWENNQREINEEQIEKYIYYIENK